MLKSIILFLIQKNVCIKFDDNVNDYEHVYINNTLVQWANEVKQLGNIVQCSLYICVFYMQVVST